mmetsp:Transcript_24930/g.56530  ORF Transcript_24930/g.56530 Transcript_24930/m.56530 type:complete len:94 (-) Transcript_24930:187-468(-)
MTQSASEVSPPKNTAGNDINVARAAACDEYSGKRIISRRTSKCPLSRLRKTVQKRKDAVALTLFVALLDLAPTCKTLCESDFGQFVTNCWVDR